eukprot:m.116105 g.116105  ORF g.116105 m.116105 type:complete len:876 (+) comp14461_c0_seq4:99-2726(+)
MALYELPDDGSNHYLYSFASDEESRHYQQQQQQHQQQHQHQVSVTSAPGYVATSPLLENYEVPIVGSGGAFNEEEHEYVYSANSEENVARVPPPSPRSAHGNAANVSETSVDMVSSKKGGSGGNFPHDGEGGRGRGPSLLVPPTPAGRSTRVAPISDAASITMGSSSSVNMLPVKAPQDKDTEQSHGRRGALTTALLSILGAVALIIGIVALARTFSSSSSSSAASPASGASTSQASTSSNNSNTNNAAWARDLQAIQTSLQQEQVRADAMLALITTLNSSLVREQSRAQAAEDTLFAIANNFNVSLSTATASLQSRAASVNISLASALQQEQSRATAAEGILGFLVNSLVTNVSAGTLVTTQLQQEQSQVRDTLNNLNTSVTNTAASVASTTNDISILAGSIALEQSRAVFAETLSLTSLNNSLFCNDRGLLFSRSSNTCNLSATTSKACSTPPPPVPNGMLSGPSCMANAISSSVCTPTCAAGLTLRGLYICIGGVWGGTPSCTNGALTWVTPTGLIGAFTVTNTTPATVLPALSTVSANGLPITYALVDGSLAPGVTFNSTTGTFGGTLTVTPTVPSPLTNCTYSSYSFTVAASNGISMVNRQFTMAVGAPVSLVFTRDTNPGTATWTVPQQIFPSFVEVLVVAGGGGGAARHGGGGGAGGLIYNSSYAVTPGDNITYTVGAGAAAVLPNGNNAVPGASGGNSVFGAILAYGGAGGGSLIVGGSGAGSTTTLGSSAGRAGQGNGGGQGCAGNTVEAGFCGGGGGGAGGVGGSATCITSPSVSCAGGAGGSGVTYWGVSYAAGGGGGANLNSVSAGVAGPTSGGAGSLGLAQAGSGLPGTGSGGGGSGFSGGVAAQPGAGGNGAVVLRYCVRI